MSTDLTGLIPYGWHGGEAVTKWWRGKHLHLYRLRKNCAQCGKEMTIDVTKAAITGTAKNAGLHLARCQTCREKSRAADSQQPGMSRPFAKHDPMDELAALAPKNDEVEMLRAQNEMFMRSIQALQQQLADLKRVHDVVAYEHSVMKAKYDLPAAMQAQKTKPLALPPEPLTMAQSTANMNATKNKMPWN